MPAPASFTYEVDTLEAAHQAVLDLIDGGTGAGKVRLLSEADTTLAVIPLTDPAGTINTSTGQLTLTASGPDTSADATGICTWAQIEDGDNVAFLSLPASAGTSAVSGQIVINSVSIVAGAEVTLVSATIG